MLLALIFVTLSWNVHLFGCDMPRPNAVAKSRMKRFGEAGSEKINRKWESTWSDKLKKDLLLNYDKFSRPAQIGIKILVYTNIIIRHLEVDEQRSIMTLHLWIPMKWNDEKLKWNASEYGGLKELHVADHEIWQPDIFPYNGIIDGLSDHYGNINCVVQDNGTILWVPPSKFQVFCELDLTYWPFDTQMCSLTLGSWTYHGEQIDLEFSDSSSEIDEDLIRNSEWKLVKVDKKKRSIYYNCCPNPYSDITYNITVERQSPTYVALLITPATAIIVMALCVFLLPPTSTDKITLGGTAIIITCLFLLYFTQKLPAMAGRTPLIVLFYSRTLYFLSFSVIISVIVINLAKNPKFSPLPWSIKSLLTGWLGKCLFVNNFSLQAAIKSARDLSFKPEEMADSLPVLPDQEKQHGECSSFDTHQQDWILLAVAIDRIAFLLYCLIFIILALTYSV